MRKQNQMLQYLKTCSTLVLIKESKYLIYKFNLRVIQCYIMNKAVLNFEAIFQSKQNWKMDTFLKLNGVLSCITNNNIFYSQEEKLFFFFTIFSLE